MASQANDYLLGFGSERRCISLLGNFFTKPFFSNGRYAPFDYSDEAKTIYVELKTRRINHDTYPTTIIGANKVEQCNDPTKQYWFAYCYQDGIYVIQYNKELFDTFETNPEYQRSNRSDTMNNSQHVIFIPIHHLAQIA